MFLPPSSSIQIVWHAHGGQSLKIDWITRKTMSSLEIQVNIILEDEFQGDGLILTGNSDLSFFQALFLYTLALSSWASIAGYHLNDDWDIIAAQPDLPISIQYLYRINTRWILSGHTQCIVNLSGNPLPFSIPAIFSDKVQVRVQDYWKPCEASSSIRWRPWQPAE